MTSMGLMWQPSGLLRAVHSPKIAAYAMKRAGDRYSIELLILVCITEAAAGVLTVAHLVPCLHHTQAAAHAAASLYKAKED